MGEEEEIEMVELDELAEALNELRSITKIKIYSLKEKKPRFLKKSIKQMEWFIGNELGKSKIAR